ncbi:MAG TPA: hypothetical protein VN816_09670 [Acidimicrobiales bacterium]|nr:hypothetical protein [Acidimicrobiales bacterium]
MRILCRATGALILVLAATAAAALPAGAVGKGKVGPKQYFTGVINGTDGNTVNPITIEMACFGPLHPGQTGHPLKGQTLAVHQLFPPGPASGSLGYTGTDSEIGVFFNAPPPAGSAARAAAGTPVFLRYDRPRPLPTSLTLPCSGTGTVWFVPIPVVPPSSAASVPVQFAGQP